MYMYSSVCISFVFALFCSQFTKAEKVAGNGNTAGVTGLARQSSMTGNPVQMTGHMMGQQSMVEMGGSMSPSGVPQATQQPMATGYSYGGYGTQVVRQQVYVGYVIHSLIHCDSHTHTHTH